MAKRVITKIGDIFSISINEKEKRYMQLIAYDLTQLNSDVVRIFEKKYTHESKFDLKSIIEDNVLIYAHCSTNFGIKLNLWEKVDNSSNVGNIRDIIFKDTNNYGHKQGDEPIKLSHNWHIWRIGDDKFTKVGKLEGENRKANIGLVINPFGIVELAKGNKYPGNYPDFE